MFFGGREEHLPPGPHGHWLAGNLADYEQDRLGYLQRLRDDYGPLARLGPRTTVVNDPALAVHVLRESTDAFATRENFLQKHLSEEQSRELAELRRALNPGLRRDAVQPVEDVVAERLAAELRTTSLGAGAWSDPLPWLERVIAGAVAEFYFGPLDAASIGDQTRELLDELTRVIGNPFALPQSWGTAVRRRIDRRHRDLRRGVEQLLRAREAGCGRSDVASGILARADRDSRTKVADMVIGSLLAAQRVPAAGAAWLLMLLAEHPEAQGRIRSGPPSGSAPAPRDGPRGGRSAPGPAECVVLESLRLYPPTWLITRTSTRPVSVGGYRFPAQHHFMVSPYVLHRDPAQFSEPELFRPERWATAGRHPLGYLPFGAGTHVCPGRHLAVVILSSLARRITQGYAVVRNDEPITADPRTTLLPRGLQVALRAREGVDAATSRSDGEGQLLASAETAPF